MLVEDLLLVLYLRHSILVTRVDVDPRIIDLMDLTLMIKVACRVLDQIINIIYIIKVDSVYRQSLII